MRITLAIVVLLALPCARQATAQQLSGGVDYADDTPLPCRNCGHPSNDWKRYRNTVFNACIYGAGPTPYLVHQCKDMIDNHVWRGDPDWIRVCVLPELEDVVEGPEIDYGCQPVYIKLTFDPGIRPDIPWISIGDYRNGEVSGIIVRITLPNADTKDTHYAADQDILLTTPDVLPYPANHPWAGSNSNDGPGDDPGGNDGGNTTPGLGGECTDGNHNHVLP